LSEKEALSLARRVLVAVNLLMKRNLPLVMPVLVMLKFPVDLLG
jgi:hypothetical protein